MSCFIVTYDLHKQGQNYKCIHDKLEAYPVHWRMQGSVWIISTNEKATEIRDKLMKCLDDNDKLFVGKLSGEAAWSGYNDKTTKWLKDCLS